MPYNLLFLTIISLSLLNLQASPSQGLRVLDNSGRTPKTNIEIPIKAQEADYYVYRFNDPTIFYAEKIMGPLGVNDICTLQNSHFSLTKPLVLPELSSPYFLNGDRILSVDDKSIDIYGLQSDFERLRSQLITTVALPASTDSDETFVYDFNPANQQMIAVGGKRIYVLSAGNASIQKVIDLSSNPIDVANKRIFYYDDKYLLVFDKGGLKLEIYNAENEKLVLEKRVENCYEIYVDTKNVLIFTHDQIKTFSEEEIVVEFGYEEVYIAPANHGVVIYAKNKGNNTHEATVLHVELLEEKGFKVTPLFNCPLNAKGIYYTMNNIYLAYENWVRVYPLLKDMQLSGDLHFDFAMNNPVAGVMYTKDHDYLAIEEGDSVALYGNYRSEVNLECKKERNSDINEYVFQIHFVTLNCDTVDFSTQKFANGSCSYTKNILVYPTEERSSFGTVALVMIGSVAGILVTVGLTFVKCVGNKQEKIEIKTHSPKPKEKKKTFNINKGLRRLHHSPSSTNETRKFLHEDESYPSEDMRYSMSNSMTQNQKKKPVIFETPRFTSFGGGQSNHANVNYHSVTPDTPQDADSKSSGDVDIDITDVQEKQSKVNVGKLKLGGFQNLVRDPTSFRNIGVTLPQSPGKSDHHGQENLEGKYAELQENDDDDNEEENNNNNENENNGFNEDLGSGDVHSGSFSN